MRVAVYRNYREEQQPSMRIYADMLIRYLPQIADIRTEEVRPVELVPRVLRGFRAATKLGDFSGRYLAAPLLAPRAGVDLHHIVDHGSAHLLARLGTTSTVVTCHDLIPLLTARGRLPRGQVPFGARLIFRTLMTFLPRAKLIIAISETTKSDLVRELRCDASRIRVIPLGLADEHFAVLSREELLEAEVRLRLGPRPRMLSVGVNWPHKNLTGVLQVLARIRRECGRGSLLRVGTALHPEQRALAEKLEVASSVQELGGLPVRDLTAVYRLSDILLFPSYYEGFGWPPLEAMAAGLPVVASPCGSIPEVSGDVPLYAAPDLPDELAAQALRFLRDPVLRALHIARGYERARRFVWPETARATAEAYRWVLEN
jgi:glycosyltransferase involved in cell wall biosynthesis